MKRVALVQVVLGVAALPSIARGAGGCDVLNKAPAEAVLKVSGREETLAPGAWKALPDCSAIQVVKGPVQVRGLVGGVPAKATCDAGPCTLPQGRSVAVSSTSSYRLVAGGHRMDEEVARRLGAPWGEVYAVEVAARFEFPDLTGRRASFQLSEAQSRAPVFTGAVLEGKVAVPTGALKRGTRYAWSLTADGQELASGGFQLTTADDAARVSQELAALDATSGRSPAEKLLDELAVYVANDLGYEAALLREALRSQR